MSNETDSLVEFISNFGDKQITEVGLAPLVGLLLLSLICSLFISFLYFQFYKKRSTGSQIYRAFPLLGLSITAIFICIQFSLPLSLGLLGALSIVRFRTPIKEPEEIGFIMLLIAISISCATFNIGLLAAILALGIASLLILDFGVNLSQLNTNSGVIICSISNNSAKDSNTQLIIESLLESIKGSKVDSISESDEELSYSVSFPKLNMGDFKKTKSKLQEINNEISLNVFFNKNGM